MGNYLEYEAKVLDALKTIFDPEIPVNIYDLGLIYEIKVSDTPLNKKKAYVKMTLTAPNCPVAESLPIEVRDKVSAVEGIDEAEVELTFDPPWDRNNMSDEAMLELGLL